MLVQKKRQKAQNIQKCVSDEEMVTEIIRELTTIKETNKVTSKQVLCWAIRRVEFQRV